MISSEDLLATRLNPRSTQDISRSYCSTLARAIAYCGTITGKKTNNLEAENFHLNFEFLSNGVKPSVCGNRSAPSGYTATRMISHLRFGLHLSCRNIFLLGLRNMWVSCLLQGSSIWPPRIVLVFIGSQSLGR